MHILFKSQIFCSCQCNLWRDQTFYNRVICQVQKHCHVIGNTAFFKCVAEEISNVMFYTHSGKYNCKFFIRITSERGLFYDLCSKLIVRKSISGENRKLLSTNQSCQSVDRGNSGADIVSWVFSADRVERKSVHISF